MKACLAILAATLIVCSGYEYSLFEDPCRICPRPDLGPGETATMQANTSCTTGWIEWMYPRGNIRVVFKEEDPAASFLVCIRNAPYTDVTTGKEVRSDWTVRGRPCAASTQGQVTLEFQSHRFSYYMARISYKVKYAPRDGLGP